MGSISINIDWERRVLMARHAGAWTVEDSEALMADTIRLSDETGIVRVLYDHRDLDLDRTTIQIFRRSEDLQQVQGVARLKMALVHPTDDLRLRTDYQFFEDSMVNRGMTVRVFDGDIAAAVDWLTGS